MFFVLPHGFQDVLQKGIGLGERWRRLVTLIDSRNVWEHGGEAVLRQGMLGRMMGKMCCHRVDVWGEDGEDVC